MPRFKNGWAYIHYSQSVRQHYRFTKSPEVAQFLQALIETSSSRLQKVPKGSLLWRAQLGNTKEDHTIDGEDMSVVVEDPVPFPAERMKPQKNASHEGRANPKGIPYLYVATDKETAMSEVRPWVGANISLGKFKTVRDLQLVNLSIEHDLQLTPEHLFGPLSDEEMEKGIWAQVDKAFSTPITDDATTAEYAPTQVIAEAFRYEQFDGLVYRSKLSDGFNIVLFDLQAAELVHCQLYQVDEVKFTFSQKT